MTGLFGLVLDSTVVVESIDLSVYYSFSLLIDARILTVSFILDLFLSS